MQKFIIYTVKSAWYNLNYGEPESRAAALFGGANPPDERKEGDMMYVTYSDLFQFSIFVIALISLCHTIFKGKK